MYFASDNSGPVHPQVMAALNEANQGYQMAYGADTLMNEVRDRIRGIFETFCPGGLLCENTLISVVAQQFPQEAACDIEIEMTEQLTGVRLCGDYQAPCDILPVVGNITIEGA